MMEFLQELKEEHHGGINPDYGIGTPTLVSPPKVTTKWIKSRAPMVLIFDGYSEHVANV